MGSRDYLAKNPELKAGLIQAVKKVLEEKPEYPTSVLVKVLSESNKKVVCVTGCTGFVASEVVKQCLELGWTVRGTARNPNDDSKVGYLKRMAAGLPGKLDLVQADLLQPGSFDAAVMGCEYVFHVASPFFFGGEAEGPAAVEQKLIRPAVEGTKNVLGSVAKFKASIKCVALTSSVVAVSGFGMNPEKADKPVSPLGKFSEDDWNITSNRETSAYLLSKTLAEKAAWDIASKEGFKMCTICPSFVLGPPNTDRDDGTSLGFGLNLLKTGVIGLMGFPCVDVRDVGKAHIAVCMNPNSFGRYILSTSWGVPAWWAYDVLEPLDIPNLVKPDKPDDATLGEMLSNDKVRSTEPWKGGLGIELTEMKTTLVDMITSMKISHAGLLH